MCFEKLLLTSLKRLLNPGFGSFFSLPVSRVFLKGIKIDVSSQLISGYFPPDKAWGEGEIRVGDFYHMLW